jgi:hypothetical protein
MSDNSDTDTNESPFEQHREHGEVLVIFISYLYCASVHSVLSSHPLSTVVNIKEKVFSLGGYEGVVTHLTGKTQHKSISEKHAKENVWTLHKGSKNVGKVTC